MPLELNTIMNPYGLNDDDARISHAAAIYVVANDKMDLSPFLDIEGLYISEFNNETNIVLSDDMESIYHLTCPIVTETDDKDFIPAFSNSILLCEWKP